MSKQNVLNPLYSVYFAPRGMVRMLSVGREIAQRHLSTFDRLIGLVGDSGSGKSLIIKGMFPGLELTNDDDGVNVRPLPILDIEESVFYQPHSYHIDVRFEMGFTQLPILAQAVKAALDKGKRIVIEHFDLIYPYLNMNAELLIGIGDEIIVARPTIFGPLPEDVAKTVYASIKFRRMAHSTEDLTEHVLAKRGIKEYQHGDVRRGFLLRFEENIPIDIPQVALEVQDLINQDLPISYCDSSHILIGDILHSCTGPRMHMSSTGKIERFILLNELQYDTLDDSYLLVGLVDDGSLRYSIHDLNRIQIG